MDESIKIARRLLLQSVPFSILANVAFADANHQCGSAPSPATDHAPYRFRFFTPDEVELFDSVAEQIIPSDEHSPGAREARVVQFADLMVSTSSEYVQADWRTGLQLLAAEWKGPDAQAWLTRVSQAEEDPRTVLEIFFRTLKQTVVNGYYSSEIGIHQELRYQGNTYLTAFPGCEHPEHKAIAPDESQKT